jgi:hypothetical protein
VELAGERDERAQVFQLPLRPAHRGEQRAVQTPGAERSGAQAARVRGMAHHPVGQCRDPLAAGHQEQDHRGQFRLADAGRLDPGRLQEIAEHVHARAFDRVGDQQLIGQIRGCDPVPHRQRMRGRQHQAALVVEQRQEGQIRGVDRIRGDHQIDVAGAQGGQRVEGQPQADVHIDRRPVRLEPLQHRHQPLETGMALDGQVQPAGVAGGEPRQLALGLLESGQGVAGQGQQPVPGGGEPHRPGVAVEQRHPIVVLQQLDLVGERRGRQVELLRGPRQTAGVGHGEQVAQVLAVQHGEINSTNL